MDRIGSVRQRVFDHPTPGLGEHPVSQFSRMKRGTSQSRETGEKSVGYRLMVFVMLYDGLLPVVLDNPFAFLGMPAQNGLSAQPSGLSQCVIQQPS